MQKNTSTHQRQTYFILASFNREDTLATVNLIEAQKNYQKTTLIEFIATPYPKLKIILRRQTS